MLTLHGFPYSNYHNIVKHALMHKGVEFEEHIVYPGMPELAKVSPVGKVPAITTEDGTHLSESSVIVDYLEDRYPANALYPAEPEARAKVRQIMKVAELYLELSARRLLTFAIGQTEAPQSLCNEVKATLDRGMNALEQLASFSPYLCGNQITLADIYLRYALAIAKLVGPKFLQWNPLDAVEGLKEWDALMADSDIARQIDADQQENAKPFMAYVAASMKK